VAELIRIGHWAEFSWLRHGFSRRGGGVSEVYGPGDLNLGWTKEDDPAKVVKNRERWTAAVGGEGGMKLVTVRQVHGAASRVLKDRDGVLEGRLVTAEGRAVLEGDGLMTNLPGVLLGIQTADCVPVLVVDPKNRAVAAFHAGWRGTVAKVVEQGIATMKKEYGSRPEELLAAVGPSIGSCCYAVGDEVRGEFEAATPYAEELFRKQAAENGVRVHLDLWEANRRQLVEAGVRPEKIVVVGECSGCAVDEAGRRVYFSHRMEKGITGRMMSGVGVV